MGAAPAGLTFNADGTYSFDAANAAYQSLGVGQSAVLTVPYTVTDDQGADVDRQPGHHRHRHQRRAGGPGRQLQRRRGCRARLRIGRRHRRRRQCGADLRAQRRGPGRPDLQRRRLLQLRCRQRGLPVAGCRPVRRAHRAVHGHRRPGRDVHRQPGHHRHRHQRRAGGPGRQLQRRRGCRASPDRSSPPTSTPMRR